MLDELLDKRSPADVRAGMNVKRKSKVIPSEHPAYSTAIFSADNVSPPRAAFKKFPTRVAAEEYIGGSGAHSKTSRSAIEDITVPTTTTGSSVNISPTASSAQSSGYTITPDSHIVVWTDGSAVGNGKKGSVGGLGVFWGKTGKAVER